MTNIVDILHPDYKFEDYCKWRVAYEGGTKFINRYLYKLSERETDADFLIRKQSACCPGHAASAITDIKNAIYQRTVDVVRQGGPKSYQKALEDNIVDLEGNGMNSFIGMTVLEEMLLMSKVGVLTDMPSDLGQTELERGEKRPYLSYYVAESIKSWSYKSCNNERYLTSICLEETREDVDAEYGLVKGYAKTYRHMQLTPKGVLVTFYGEKGEAVRTTILNLPRIPFTIFEIPFSLMTNVADYQIALMNLESSDFAFLKKSNFPIYYEFYDPKLEQEYKKPIGPPVVSDGTSSVQTANKKKEVSVGLSKGRRFPEGTNAPGFAQPSAETLRVSMEKQDQMKEDIRKLINLNVSQLRSSAESKKEDTRTLESGLSFLGLVLQKGEIDIARHWCNFENSKDKPTIKYPKNYSIKTDEDREKSIESLEERLNKIPSDKYRRKIAKKIIYESVGSEITGDELQEMYAEIDKAPGLTCNTDELQTDVELGLVTKATASLIKGYKPDEVEKAKKERAEDIKLTLEAQGGPQGDGAARGAPAFGGKTGSSEKEGKRKRGEGKKIDKGE